MERKKNNKEKMKKNGKIERENTKLKKSKNMREQIFVLYFSDNFL